MRATISSPEPHIVREAKRGDLFLAHSPGLQECVLAILGEPRSLNEFPLTSVDVIAVVIACRVGSGEPGCFLTGTRVRLSGDAPITFVEPVETVAFRQRKPLSNG